MPGKLLATNSRISGTRKGKPAGNLGSTLVRTFRTDVFFEIEAIPSSSECISFFSENFMGSASVKILVLGFRGQGEANVLRTLGRHCLDLMSPTSARGVLLKSTVPSPLEFSETLKKDGCSHFDDKGISESISTGVWRVAGVWCGF